MIQIEKEYEKYHPISPITFAVSFDPTDNLVRYTARQKALSPTWGISSLNPEGICRLLFFSVLISGIHAIYTRSNVVVFIVIIIFQVLSC